MNRTNLSARQRFAILMRDRFCCLYCGARPGMGGPLEVDHLVPVSKGGTNDPGNLVTACPPCNAGKSDVLIAGLALRALLQHRDERDAERTRLNEACRAEQQVRREELRQRLAERLARHQAASEGPTGVQ